MKTLAIMKIFEIILLFAFYIGVESKKCGIGPKGILCELSDNNSDEKCKDLKERTLTNEDKKFIVEEHNQLRHRIATGVEKSLPKAFFMKKLFWDDELAVAAQKWANQCGKKFQPDDKQKFLIGANIAFAIHSGKKFDLSELINKWKLGLRNLNELLVNDFRAQMDESIEQSAQLIWSNTDKIGCGVSQYKDDQCRGILHKTCPLVELVCFYSPPGNINGLPMYSIIDNKNLTCVNETSDILCDKIIYKDSKVGKMAGKDKEGIEDLSIQGLLKASYEHYYKSSNRLGRAGEPTEPTSDKGKAAHKACNIATDDNVNTCKGAAKTYRNTVNVCFGKDAEYEGNAQGATDLDKNIAAVMAECETKMVKPAGSEQPPPGDQPTFRATLADLKASCQKAIINLDKLYQPDKNGKCQVSAAPNGSGPTSAAPNGDGSSTAAPGSKTNAAAYSSTMQSSLLISSFFLYSCLSSSNEIIL